MGAANAIPPLLSRFYLDRYLFERRYHSAKGRMYLFERRYSILKLFRHHMVRRKSPDIGDFLITDGMGHAGILAIGQMSGPFKDLMGRLLVGQRNRAVLRAIRQEESGRGSQAPPVPRP